MGSQWLEQLHVNPLPALLAGHEPALEFHVKRDLLQQPVPPVSWLWSLPEVDEILKLQQAGGSWRYPGQTARSNLLENYTLLETYRSLRLLVEMYGLTREHPQLARAVEFIFTCQTPEGDIRGILSNQYMPYYHGAILELVIKAGYGGDPRTITGLDWLLTMRQDDGGWMVPTQAVPSAQRTKEYWLGAPLQPQRWLPHAHLATGMVLRAFAAHPDYRARPEVLAAGSCLKSRMFQQDHYNDRKSPAYWVKYQYPFWWTSLLTALDTLSILGFTCQEPEISHALDWFLQNQEPDGLWPTGYGFGKKAAANRRWVALAVCRVLKRLMS